MLWRFRGALTIIDGRNDGGGEAENFPLDDCNVPL
jgi:hypothetical protein